MAEGRGLPIWPGRMIIMLGAMALASPSTQAQHHKSAQQATRQLSRTYDACLKASQGVTVDMRDCAAAEAIRLDAKLNEAYRTAMERLPSRKAQNQLRQSERAWLATRYDHCRMENKDEEAGTLWYALMDDCWLDTLAARILWLQHCTAADSK